MERCRAHGLATGPDGLCVVCRRERGAEPASPRLAIGIAAALLLAVLGAGAVHMSRRPSNATTTAVAASESANVATAPTRVPGAQPAGPGSPTARFEPTSDRPSLPPPGPAGATPAPPDPAPIAANAPIAPTAAIAPTATGPDAADLAIARRSVTITMYTTTWCPRCKEAKAWMAANGVSYSERDIEASDTNRAECKRFNPETSIPTTVIDGAVLIGFGERYFRDAIDGAARRRWRASR